MLGPVDAMSAADQHVLARAAAKEIAAQHGNALTTMPRVDEGVGNAAHLTLTLRDLAGASLPEGGSGRPDTFRSFLAGLLVTMREFTLLLAPNVNSYKRFQPGDQGPTAIAWGHDNRSCALRVLGSGAGRRVECRVPGGDVNPYLGIAALLAGGLWGVQMDLAPEPALAGDATVIDRQRLPTTLREARDAFESSVLARNAFGDDVVDHYVHAADVELAAFEAAVTDWERRRSFERL